MKTTAYLILAIYASSLTAPSAAIRLEGQFEHRIQIDLSERKRITEADIRKSREFHSKDGKVLAGRILAYSPDNETVTISDDHGKRSTIDVGVLSEADQAYVREWQRLMNFFDPEQLQISVKRLKSKGDMELLIWKPTEEIIYEITLKNRCGFDLENLTLNYFVCYDRPPPPQDQKQKVITLGSGGKLKVGTLAAGKLIRLKTPPETIPVDDLYEDYKDNTKPIARLKGIMIQILLPLDGTEKAMRELFHPTTPNKHNVFAPDATREPFN